MTGRPKNPEIEPSNAILIKIYNEILIGVFFKDVDRFQTNKNHTAIFERSKHISNVAKTYGINLNVIELKKKLFSPFEEKENISLSKNYIKRICSFLELSASDYNFADKLSLIDAFRNIHVNDDNQSDLSESTMPEKHKLITKMLCRAEWYFYERVGEIHIKDTDFGIAVGEVKFRSVGDLIEATLQMTYEETNRKYVGSASFDDGYDYLFMDLILEGSGKRATITLRLSEYDTIYQTICLGHFTYHSKHYSHLLTKAVIMQLKSESIIQLIKGEYLYNTSGYIDIDEEIKQFLYPRDKNRLSLARKIISNKKELKGFLKHKFSTVNPILKKHFQGDYHVYYRNFNEVIMCDDLSIKASTNTSEIEGVYTHRPDENKSNNKKWGGKTYLNKKFIVLELSEIQNDERKPEEDPILLTFYTSDEDLNFNDCECFPGLLTGLQDSLRTPISYVCLVTRKNVNDFNGVADESLSAYFNRSRVTKLTPSVLAFKIKDLA